VTKWVILADPHAPYHNPWALELARKFLASFLPDILIVAGDLVDFHGLSRFDRDPKRRMNTDLDVAAGGQWLDAVADPLPGHAKKVFLEGNHDDRLRRFVWDKVPELAGLPGLSLPALLELERRQWDFIPYHNTVPESGAPGFYRDGILVVHGFMARKWSGATARAHWERFGGNGIVGHCHRLGVFQHRFFGEDGQNIWYEAGCMCSLEPGYEPGPDWQNGFVAGRVYDVDPTNRNPRFDFTLAQIIKRKLTWEGRTFRV
jgi:hypothetical protein